VLEAAAAGLALLRRVLRACADGVLRRALEAAAAGLALEAAAPGGLALEAAAAGLALLRRVLRACADGVLRRVLEAAAAGLALEAAAAGGLALEAVAAGASITVWLSIDNQRCGLEPESTVLGSMLLRAQHRCWQ
jgi:hypothetical protein